MAIISLTHLLSTPSYSERPYLSPDGRYLFLYTNGSTDPSGVTKYPDGAVILDLVDGGVAPLTLPAGISGSPYMHFQGWGQGQVYFWSMTNGSDGLSTMFVGDVETGNAIVATPYKGATGGATGLYGPMSSNGRYMLQQPIENGQPGKIIWRDRDTGEARPLAGLEGKTTNVPSPYAVSDDGRWVMFRSLATDIVPGDTNGTFDYFVQDMLTGKVTAVQSSTDGTVGNSYIYHAVMSPNGRYVAFNGESTNLVDDGAATRYGAYVKDLVTGAIVRVSTDAAGKPLQYGADVASISADGRYVTMTVGGDIGMPGVSPYGPHIVVKDLQTGGLGLVSRGQDISFSTVASTDVSTGGDMVAYMGVEMVTAPQLHAVFHVFASARPEFMTAAVDSRHAGGAGADTLAGALGNDAYDVNHPGDIVIEHAGQGSDTVYASINYILPEHIEHLILSGAALDGAGNGLDNLVSGTAGNNVLRAGAGNDILAGMGGADTLYGDPGFDIARFGGSVNGYTVTRSSWRTEVRNKDDGTVSYLHDIEHLRFADAEVTFDTDGTAAMAYRLYQAAFDRKPDAAGLGYWISRLEAGVGIDQVAQQFVDSVEFKTLFGTKPSNSQLVEGLYRHVLHRAPEASGLAYWIEVLDRGAATSAAVLQSFSESQENQDALIGIIGHGIAYTPYGG